MTYFNGTLIPWFEWILGHPSVGGHKSSFIKEERKRKLPSVNTSGISKKKTKITLAAGNF